MAIVLFIIAAFAVVLSSFLIGYSLGEYKENRLWEDWLKKDVLSEILSELNLPIPPKNKHVKEEDVGSWKPDFDEEKIRKDVREMKKSAIMNPEHRFPLIICTTCNREEEGGFLHPDVNGPMCHDCYDRKIGLK